MKRVTMADVARHCGVSKMTVSRVVNGIRCVKEETRKRVEASVAELGYKPDPVLRILRAAYDLRSHTDKATQNRATVAYLDFDGDDYSINFFEKARAAAADLGYALGYFEFPEGKREQGRLSHRLWMRGIRGLLFGPARHRRYIDGFRADPFAMAGIGPFDPSFPIDTVGSDYFQNLFLAAHHCRERGARRIALYLSPERDLYTGHRWVGAYHAFCQQYEQEPLQCPIPSVLSGAQRTKEVVKWVRQNKVDAFIGLQGVRSFQYRLPDVFFACLNGWLTPANRKYLPGTGYGHVDVPLELVAKEAFGLLDYNLLHRRYGIPLWSKHIAVEGKWRTSLADEPVNTDVFKG